MILCNTFFSFLLLLLAGNLAAQDIEARLAGTGTSNGFDIRDKMNRPLFTVRGGGNVGLGTYTPIFRLSLEKDGGILAKGTYGSGATLPSTSGPVMIWYPRKAAFRVGNASSGSWDDAKVGSYSLGAGNGPAASGDISTAFGNITTSSGHISTAMGSVTTASGSVSTAMGFKTTASGFSSTAMGDETTSTGEASTAMGYKTRAQGNYSIATGNRSIASGERSSAMGFQTTASGLTSTALGSGSKASGLISTAIGINTIASGNYSTAIGYESVATSDASTAIGYKTTASGKYSTAMGFLSRANGYSSTAMGYKTTASGDYGIVIGYQAYASGAQAVTIGSWVSTNGHKGSMILGDASSTTYRRSYKDNRFYAYFDGGFSLLTNGSGGYCVYLDHNSNSWKSCSDSTKKENYRAADGEEVLVRISAFRLGSWNYKGQHASRYRHYGAMAQEWFTAFGHDGVGLIGNDTSLSSADVDGIAYIAIQALERRTAELREKTNDMETLKEKLTELQTRDEATQKQLEAMRIKVSEMDTILKKYAAARGEGEPRESQLRATHLDKKHRLLSGN